MACPARVTVQEGIPGKWERGSEVSRKVDIGRCSKVKSAYTKQPGGRRAVMNKVKQGGAQSDYLLDLFLLL